MPSEEKVEETYSINELGMFYSPPVIRDGDLYRGVISCISPQPLLGHLDRDKWVYTVCEHSAVLPKLHEEADLYQCDPWHLTVAGSPIGRVDHVFAIARDFVSPDIYHPLDVEKKYDVIFNACWVHLKRHNLMLEALKWAKANGRPISCLFYGYHWHSSNGSGTDGNIEHQVRSTIEEFDLPCDVLPTAWDGEENNRRFNICRIAVLLSTSEAGPRVMPEAMLAGLPYFTSANTTGGSTRYLRPENKNGGLLSEDAETIAREIWYALDHLDDFEPRKWALSNMCKPVAVEKMQTALKSLERKKGWKINWQGVNHEGSTGPTWFDEAMKAEKAVKQILV